MIDDPKHRPKQSPAPPGLRLALDRVVGGDVIDGLSESEVIRRLTGASKDTAEIESALRRLCTYTKAGLVL
jgi:hypothetical protein